MERVIKALIQLGLSRLDAQIYILVSKNASISEMALMKCLNYSKNQIFSCIRNLITIGLLKREGMFFSAIPFEDALNLLIKNRREEAYRIEKH